MKIVINAAYGGFRLSRAAYELLGLEWGGDGLDYYAYNRRYDPALVAAVEKLGDKGTGRLPNCGRRNTG